MLTKLPTGFNIAGYLPAMAVCDLWIMNPRDLHETRVWIRQLSLKRLARLPARAAISRQKARVCAHECFAHVRGKRFDKRWCNKEVTTYYERPETRIPLRSLHTPFNSNVCGSHSSGRRRRKERKKKKIIDAQNFFSHKRTPIGSCGISFNWDATSK